MGSSPGEDAERAVRRRRALVRLTLLTAVAGVAWGLLVGAAIALGRSARAGSGGWTPVVLAGVAAACCLFAALLLGSRAVAVARGADPVRRRAGGHRAARR